MVKSLDADGASILKLEEKYFERFYTKIYFPEISFGRGGGRMTDSEIVSDCRKMETKC